MIETQYITLDMKPSGVLPVLYCSQYDIGRPLGMVVYNGGEAVDLGDYTVTIEATRTDGVAITAAVTTSGNIGAFETTATMTNKADRYGAQLVLSAFGKRVASLPFVMVVVKAAMDENAESIEEDASLYQQFTETVQSFITALNAELRRKTGWYYMPEDYGAVGDGVTDDTAAIQSMFDAMNDYDVCVFTAKKYIVSAEITITNNFLSINGHFGKSEYSPIIYSTVTSGNIIKVMGYGCAFNHLMVQGIGRGTTTAVGIAFDQDNTTSNANTDADINFCTFYALEYGVSVKGRNLSVRNSTFSTCRYGAWWKQTEVLTNAELRGHLVENCTFHGTLIAVLNDINNTVATKNLTIKGNVLNGGSSTLFTGYDGNLIIQDNIVYFVSLISGGGNVITLSKNAYADSTTEANVIKGNVIKIYGKNYAGIDIVSGVKAIITNNYIEKAGRRGIYIEGTSNCTVESNIIAEATSWAIEADSTATGLIANNICRDCSHTVSKGGMAEVGTLTNSGNTVTTSSVTAIDPSTGTLDSNAISKVGNVVNVSGRIYGISSVASNKAYFNIPVGFRPRAQIKCVGYMVIDGSTLIVICTIQTNGNVEMGYSANKTTTQVAFFASYSV